MPTPNGPSGAVPAQEQPPLPDADRREWRIFLLVLIGVLAAPILATALAALVSLVMWHTITILPDQAPPTPTSEAAPSMLPGGHGPA